MAISATELFCRYDNEHHLSHSQAKAVCNSAIYVTTPEESRKLNDYTKPQIIISASGMVTGGRILHHINALAGDARNCILLTGYQAEGTRGARLSAGEHKIKLLGNEVEINAEVCQLSNTSAHADYAEIIAWLRKCPTPPRKVFLTHGEKASAIAMQQHIQEDLGWVAEVPEYGQRLTI
ncbi:MAG: MBL fold metallo-hydrolase, partial [Pseudomonadota bacterium]|nr:MBL fold metallo-hydrolase [Pseudomonadota bacterium]